MTILRTQWKALLIALLLPYLQVLGCSLIGLGIGASSDSKKPDDYSFSRAAMGSVEMGTTVTLTKWDGSTMEGDYSGVITRSAEVYSKAYDRALEESDYEGYLPRLGEAATLLVNQSSLEGVYLGIDSNNVLMQREAKRDTMRICLDSVKTIEGPGGGQLQGPELRELVYDGTIMSRSYVLMWADRRTVAVPYEAVNNITVGVVKSGALTGFAIGLGLDITVIVIAVTTYEPSCEGQKFR
jgi:hypothetical protein